VQEKANRRPLVPDDRRAAAKAARESDKVKRAQAYEGMQRGEEKYLPTRDKGPQRRFIRDWVDARWNLGEFFLPAVFLMFALQFVLVAAQNPAVTTMVVGLMYLMVLAAIIDCVILWVQLRKRLREKFGADRLEKGLLWYSVMRAFQMRRMRMPKPTQAKHGVWPT
jgi:hypothetical protein